MNFHIYFFFGLCLLCESLSENLYTFFTLLNGFYTNKLQRIVDKLNVDVKDEHDVITLLWRPVQIAAFPDNWTVYLEESVNGLVRRTNILVYSEDEFGIVHGQPLDVKRPIDYIPLQYEYADLTNIELATFTSPPKCEVLFNRIEKKVFIGTYPDCVSVTHSKTPPPFSVTFTCNTLAVSVCSHSSFEHFSTLPYVYANKGRYELPTQWTEGINFTAPCNLN